MAADLPTFSIDNFGWVKATGKDGGYVQSQSVEAQLLLAIFQRLPDPDAPLAEAVEWESLDGVYRTTDKDMAQNWAGAIGVRVVRRANAGVVEAEAPSGGVVWTPEDEARLDEAIAKRNAARAARGVDAGQAEQEKEGRD